MVYLTAALALVGIVCALNLLLTVGVIRRLREHTDELAKLKVMLVTAGSSFPPGGSVADFQAADTTGAEISREQMAGTPYVMAFLSTICTACAQQLPDLVRYADEVAGAPDRVVALVGGDPAEADRYVETLEPVARVVAGAEAQRIHTDFGISVLPTYLLVDEEGTVMAALSAVDHLRAHPAGAALAPG